MDEIINILLLVIIFVFDPLAISLVVTANFAFKQAYKKEEEPQDSTMEEFSEEEIQQFYEDPDGWEEASLVDLQNLEQEEEEPYQIYVSGSDSGSMDWQIVDEEKEHQKQELDSQINSVAEQASKIQSNVNLSSWRKKKELDRINRDRQILQDKRKKLDDDDDLVIKYT